MKKIPLLLGILLLFSGGAKADLVTNSFVNTFFGIPGLVINNETPYYTFAFDTNTGVVVGDYWGNTIQPSGLAFLWFRPTSNSGACFFGSYSGASAASDFNALVNLFGNYINNGTFSDFGTRNIIQFLPGGTVDIASPTSMLVGRIGRGDTGHSLTEYYLGLYYQNHAGYAKILTGNPSGPSASFIPFDGITIEELVFNTTPNQPIVIPGGPPTLGPWTVAGQTNTAVSFSFDPGNPGTSVTLTNPTSTSTGAWTFSSSATNVVSIAGTTATIAGVGTATITATQAADATWASASITANVTVTGVAPALGGFTLPGQANGVLTIPYVPGLPISLPQPTSASTGAWTYSSSNTNVVSISGTTATITGAGSTVITATQAANGGYASASISVSVTVTASTPTPTPTPILVPASQTVTFPALAGVTYGAPPFTLTNATASSGLPVSYGSADSNLVSISNNVVTLLGAGTATITASQPGDRTHAAATPVPQQLVIGSGSPGLGITLPWMNTNLFGTNAAGSFFTSSNAAASNPISLVCGSYLDFSVTSPSGSAVVYTSSRTNIAVVTDNRLRLLGAGTVTISASQPGNSNWSASAPVYATFIVSKGTPMIPLNPAITAYYGTNEVYPLVSTDSVFGLPVRYSSSTPTVASVTNSGLALRAVGSATITAVIDPTTNTYGVTNQVALSVIRRSQTIPPLRGISNPPYGTQISLTNTNSSAGLPVTYTNSGPGRIFNNTLLVTGVGAITLKAIQAGNSYYVSVTNTITYITVKASQTVTFTNPAVFTNASPVIPYGTAISLGATSSSGLPVTNFTSSATNVAVIGRLAGTTFTPATNGTYLNPITNGTVTITAFQAGNSNYLAASNPVIVSIRRPQAITFTNLPSAAAYSNNLTYPLAGQAGSGNPITYTSSDTNVAVVNGTNLMILGVGTATITATQSGNTDWAPAPALITNIVVNPGTPVLGPFATNLSFVVGATPSNGLTPPSSTSQGSWSFTSSATNIAKVNGANLTLLGIGTATITATQAASGNYRSISTNAILVVNPNPPVLAFPDLSVPYAPYPQTYTLTNPVSPSSGAFSYTISDTNVATVSNNVVTMKKMGSTTLTVIQAAAAPYKTASNTATLTVAYPAKLYLGTNVLDFKDDQFIYFLRANLVTTNSTMASLTNADTRWLVYGTGSGTFNGNDYTNALGQISPGSIAPSANACKNVMLQFDNTNIAWTASTNMVAGSLPPAIPAWVTNTVTNSVTNTGIRVDQLFIPLPVGSAGMIFGGKIMNVTAYATWNSANGVGTTTGGKGSKVVFLVQTNGDGRVFYALGVKDNEASSALR